MASFDPSPPPHRAEARVRVLVIEDDPDDAKWVGEALATARDVAFEVIHARGLDEGLQHLQDGDFHCCLMDLSLEEGEGLDALGRVKVAAAAVPLIAMTCEDDEDLALQTLRFGAQDYLVKRHSEPRLVQRTVRHAVERHRILANLAQARQQEHYLATHDSLTGLPNRLAFLDQLRRTLAYSSRSKKQLAVMSLDVDRFKHINDSLGHPVGDELLRIVGERFRDTLRRSDMLARLGGDEFVMMLQDVQREHDPGRVAQKASDALARPCVLDGREYRVSASIGIALYPRDGLDADTLVRNADTAMYHAKAEGLNRFSYYSDAMNSVVSRRLDVENGLRSALEKNELRLEYQPQIDLESERLYGAEALLRWTHPERGSVDAAELLPIAEETGLIHEIGEWALRTACHAAVDWRDEMGRGLRISVNVSSRQLGDPGFTRVLSRALADSGLAADRLELEITESSVLQERGVTLAAARRIRELGVHIAIDDFGTGHSALSALKHLPVTSIKLDRSLVCDIPKRRQDLIITGGLIGIARELGVGVVAEGVETVRQRDALRARGCTRMQGTLYGRPLSAQGLTAELASAEPAWRRGLPDPGSTTPTV